MANEPMDRVVPLNQLDGYKVADGDPDIRGWDVMASDGRKLGRVDDLLVDTSANKVRYVGVEGGEQGRVTVPIGYARLERDSHQVLVDNLSDDQFRALPAYDREPITRDFEERVGRACNVKASAATPEFYDHDAFRGDEMRLTLSEEELVVGKRQVAAGEVGVHKHVETEHVREEVALRHDEVQVERRPITDPMAAAGRAEIREENITVPLTAEEAVVSKRVVPKEELVVSKREVVETEGVEADLRRERAEVDREVTDKTVRNDRLDNDRPGRI